MNMNFSTALIAMQRGHSVRRHNWPSDWRIAIAHLGDGDLSDFIQSFGRPSEVWQPNSLDILSHDWEIV